MAPFRPRIIIEVTAVADVDVIIMILVATTASWPVATDHGRRAGRRRTTAASHYDKRRWRQSQRRGGRGERRRGSLTEVRS